MSSLKPYIEEHGQQYYDKMVYTSHEVLVKPLYNIFAEKHGRFISKLMILKNREILVKIRIDTSVHVPISYTTIKGYVRTHLKWITPER